MNASSQHHVHVWVTRHFTDGALFHSWRCCRVCKKLLPAKGQW